MLPHIKPSTPGLTAQTYEALRDAVDLLYIRNNSSGRIHFLRAWPEAAEFIFGEELVACDTNGTDNPERRKQLEREAEDRRIALLTLLEEIPEKSAISGVLQKDHVEGVLLHLGRKISLLIYTEEMVNRIWAADSFQAKLPK